MVTRIAQGVFLAGAVLLASARPAAAQSSIGAGLSILGDDGGVGIILDYSSPFATQSGDKTLGWVVDLSLNRNSEGNALASASLTTILAQGGVRISGNAGEKLDWHGQGLVGIARSSIGTGGLAGDICDFGDCSDTSGVLTVGGALQYAWKENMALRGQLDFPIHLGSGGGSTTRLGLMVVFKR